ncbi:MAG: hypothetical protein R2864_02705 [Syntrophotaleaceae bacterium]
MIRYFWRVTVLLGLGFGLLLSGCADSQRWMGSVWSPNGNGCSASQVMSDCRQIVILPAAEQRRQVGKLQAAFDNGGSDRERFVLACVAVHPKSRYQNHGRALRLLEGYPDNKQPREDLLALKELLQELLLQKQRTEQRLVEEQQRSESLASKLKALEDIEKIIQKREERALPSP